MHTNTVDTSWHLSVGSAEKKVLFGDGRRSYWQCYLQSKEILRDRLEDLLLAYQADRGMMDELNHYHPVLINQLSFLCNDRLTGISSIQYLHLRLDRSAQWRWIIIEYSSTWTCVAGLSRRQHVLDIHILCLYDTYPNTQTCRESCALSNFESNLTLNS